MSRETRDFAFGYLASKGVPAHVAAGIVGNLAVESANFSKDVITGKRTGDRGRSKYAGQWQGNRLANLEAFAAATNRAPSDLTAQLDFIAEEMNPQSPYADPQAVQGAKSIFGAQTPEEAADAFSRHYERPSHPNMTGRKTAAVQAYESFLSGPVTNAPTPYGRDELANAPQIAMTDREIVPGLGLANLTPGIAAYTASYGPNRPNDPDQSITDSVRSSVANVFGPGFSVKGISGQGMYGAPGRHPTGLGLDFDVIDPQGNRVTDNKMMSDLAVDLAAKHGPQVGIGYGQNYMAPGRMHADIAGIGGAWGAKGMSANMDPALAAAIADARVSRERITPAFAPTPFSAPPSPQAGPSARAAQQASMAAMSQTTPSARSAQEQSMAAMQSRAPATSAPAPQAGPSARAAQEASMAAYSAPQTVASAPQAGPSARAAQEASMSAFSAYAPAQTATEALADLAAPQNEQIDMGSWGKVAPAAPQSINVARAPVQAPMAAPMQAPPAMQAPMAYAAPAPVSRAPAPSMASGLDFWGGKANVAVSNSGAQLSRDRLGNTYNYSPSYDVTTISDEKGDVIGTQQGKVAVDDSGNPAGGRGIFSDGIFSDTGLFSGRNVQNAVVGGLGQLGGTMLGSLLGGPAVGILGGALGRNFAKSRFGPQPSLNYINPAVIEAALASYQSGLGFPDAPGLTGKEWSGWSEGSGFGSRGYAEGISPGAADAIDAGRGGLY